ncbi:MAG: [FeFe] hydrogenase H-cluster radical SAM maturase HydE [Spirochaetota bacterium]
MNAANELGDRIEAARGLDTRALTELLLDPGSDTTARLAAAADETMRCEVGDAVYFRGLLEFSNVCRADCLYCGIRRSNVHVHRYTIDEADVLAAARHCAEAGYGSMTLQAGERRDAAFIEYVCRLLEGIKAETRSPTLPDGLGITLSVGEQSPDTYRRFFEAGAHRYLLRIETSSPELFARIHPPRQRYADRRAALDAVRDAGFQVGTGVMIGLPGQTAGDLAADIRFVSREEIDMIGMGPYLPHAETPMGRGRRLSGEERSWLLHQSLRMIALTRIVLPDVNIAATTALQTLDGRGRERALQGGANVVMPVVTPASVRAGYQLYDGKACVDEDRSVCAGCMSGRVAWTRRPVAINRWGDAPHFARRMHERSRHEALPHERAFHERPPQERRHGE